MLVRRYPVIEHKSVDTVADKLVCDSYALMLRTVVVAAARYYEYRGAHFIALADKAVKRGTICIILVCEFLVKMGDILIP